LEITMTHNTVLTVLIGEIRIFRAKCIICASDPRKIKNTLLRSNLDRFKAVVLFNQSIASISVSSSCNLTSSATSACDALLRLLKVYTAKNYLTGQYHAIALARNDVEQWIKRLDEISTELASEAQRIKDGVIVTTAA